MYIDNNGTKVYIFPKKLDKGSSLKRFRDYVGQENKFIAAGDSDFDVPMLLAADKGFCPKGLKLPERDYIVKLADKGFSDKMLQKVLEVGTYGI